jgi:ABC-type lipoprotein release transport system permease subunit
MSTWWTLVRVITTMALRNVWASRMKTAVTGTIIFWGALLVVFGASITQSIDRGMKASVVDSITGDIQVYSALSKDELELIDTTTYEGPDLADLDCAALRKVLATVSNVGKVVPMAVGGAAVPSPNTIDVALERLRDLERAAAESGSPDTAAIEQSKSKVHGIISFLHENEHDTGLLQGQGTGQQESVLTRALAPDFWRDFERDPFAHLEFLENQVAPLVPDSDMLFLHYVGVDPAAFRAAFPRMRIVDGGEIPAGKRGFLFAKSNYEEQLKLKIAYRLDKIKRARDERGATIAASAELQRYVVQNSTELREILLQLDDTGAARFRSLLQGELGSHTEDLRALLASFFEANDENFDARYRFFYERLAPSLQLYRLRIGDTLVIKSFTKAGYLASTSLRIYGTFEFAGLERSPLAAHVHLMDLVSFRELSGASVDQQAGELGALEAQMHAKQVTRENVEEQLFGARAAEENAAPIAPEEHDAAGVVEPPPSAPVERRQALADRAYEPGELDRGMVSSAAVFVRDRADIPETMAAIEAAGRKSGLPLKAVPWQKASGLVGQFVTTMESVLYVSVLVIFLTSLVIINNSLVMATLERVPEIGTLRAIGTQAPFIVSMIVLEALVQGVLFGAAGAGFGALLVIFVERYGIPAPNDMSYFFFSGPRLHPALTGADFAGALALVLVVSVASALYPAYLAMKVSPRQAMQDSE